MKATSTTAPFVITRDIKAPLDAVWKAWTEEDQLRQWWGPKEVEIISITNDFRVGGEFCFHHRHENMDIRGKHVYSVIDAPKRIVFKGSFCDANGEIASNPFEKNWPSEILETLEFTVQGDRTKVSITWDLIDPTDLERKAFDKERDECARGWAGLFDRLEEHLSAG